MLLKVDVKTKLATRVPLEKLRTFELDERSFQDILFRSLDRLLPDDELLLVMQSRKWQEEPDLMAIDKDGKLYIFELKAWESQSENLLQVLRYGQLFGNYSFEDLQRLYSKFDSTNQDLKEAHQARFDVLLSHEQFNNKQVFIVMTNGLDYKTREAIKYWRSSGLDIRPWVYRVYRSMDDEILLEISAFAVEDNPYEDITEGYYILNTNFRNNRVNHEDMLTNKKAAAYFSPWKNKIERLTKNDVVFLYQSGVGIVAFGTANGKLEKLPYLGDPKHKDEEYFMRLRQFSSLEIPISAAEIKEVTGVNYRFMSTMFAIDAESGRKLQAYISSRNRKAK